MSEDPLQEGRLFSAETEFGRARIARIKRGYIEQATTAALRAGHRLGSLQFVTSVATALGECGFKEPELRDFCASHGFADLDQRFFDAIVIPGPSPGRLRWLRIKGFFWTRWWLTKQFVGRLFDH